MKLISVLVTTDSDCMAVPQQWGPLVRGLNTQMVQESATQGSGRRQAVVSTSAASCQRGEEAKQLTMCINCKMMAASHCLPNIPLKSVTNPKWKGNSGNCSVEPTIDT